MKTTSRLSDLRVMTEDQLSDEALKLKKEQFNLRFQKASGQLQDTARVRVVRRDIARVMTIAAEKRAAQGQGQGLRTLCRREFCTASW